MEHVFIVTKSQVSGGILNAYSAALSAKEVTRMTSILDTPLFSNRPETSFIVVRDQDKDTFIKELKGKGLLTIELSPADVEFLTHIE